MAMTSASATSMRAASFSGGRENITTVDIPFRKAWMLSIIERIEVDDGVIRIIGDKSTLEQAVDGKPEASGGVRRSVPRWHAQRESNPCLHRERV